MGPGFESMMTKQAIDALEASDVIVGYTVYIKLLGEKFRTKELLTTPMRQEKERCHMCFKKALEGKTVSLVCSGDAGIYGLASLMYEIGQEYDNVELSVIPGITAANSGAAMSKISDVREQAIRSVLSVNSAVHRLTCLRQYLSAMRVHK